MMELEQMRDFMARTSSETSWTMQAIVNFLCAGLASQASRSCWDQKSMLQRTDLRCGQRLMRKKKNALVFACAEYDQADHLSWCIREEIWVANILCKSMIAKLFSVKQLGAVDDLEESV